MTTRLNLLLALMLLALGASGCTGGGFLGGSLGDDDDLNSDDDDDGTDDDDDDDTGPTDEDGDGVPASEDCDDTNADVFPGGDEGDTADGLDNDCSGTVDDETVCADLTGDYETIQQGIDETPDGFVLLVCAGHYYEELIASGRDVTIRAEEGPEVTTIDGDGAGQVLRVISGSDVALEDFTVTGGAGGLGGGVFCGDSTFGASGNVFDVNAATDSGGALYANDCSLWLDGNTWTGNTAVVSGGAIYAIGSGGLINNNDVSGNTAFEGGGLVAFNGNVAIEGNSFVGNEATTIDEDTWGAGSGGGGVWIRGGPSLVGNTISDNVSQYNGGGIWILQGTGLVDGNTISGNHSFEDGGGIYTNHCSTMFTNNTVTDNVANDDAGGVRVYVGSMTVADNTFIGNSAGDDGGGLKLSHSANVIRDNYFEDNSAGDAGGALELDNETAPVSGCTFINNTAGRGGGLHSWRNEGPFQIWDSHFEGNYAGCGGALAFDNDPHLVTVTDVTMIGNNANTGGAVCLLKKAQDGPDDEAGTEDDFWVASNILVRNSLFVDNDASASGGNVDVVYGEIALEFVTMHRADAPDGGSVATHELGTATVRNSISDDNDGANSAWHTDLDGEIHFSYSNLVGNDGGFAGDGVIDPVGVGGNVSVTSGFVDSVALDYTLAAGSECIDAADPAVDDLDGTRADMGTYGGPNAP